MSRLLFTSIVALLCAQVYGTIDVLSFSTNSSSFKCPKLTYSCPPPSACGYDKTLDKYYCCGAGDGAVCSTFATTCSNSNNSPGTNQIGCSSGSNAFCCLSDREQCTQRYNQVNVCWAVTTNPLANLTNDQMNATYSSLVSASPSATAVTFDPSKLLASSTHASTTGSSKITTSTTTATSPPASTSAAAGGSSGPSGATIGGAVGGAVGGLALIGGAVALWFRRKKSKEATKTKALENSYNGGGASNYAGSVQPSPQQEGYNPQGPYPGAYPPSMTPYTDAQVPQEVGNRAPNELGNNPYGPNQNLYGAYAPNAPSSAEKYAQHIDAPVEMEAINRSAAEVPGSTPIQEVAGSEPTTTKGGQNPFSHEEDERVAADNEPLLHEESGNSKK